MGNAYARVVRLSSHPAFSFSGTDATPLKCPECGLLYGRVPDYDRHFITHEPSREMAYEWMSFRSYERLAKKEGWS